MLVTNLYHFDMGTLQPQDLFKKKKKRKVYCFALTAICTHEQTNKTKPNQTQLTKKLPQAQFMCLSGPFRLCAPKAWQLVRPPVQKVPRHGSGPHCAWTALAVVLYCPALTSLVSEALATQKDPVKPPRKSGESSAKPVRDRRWEELSRWTAHLPPHLQRLHIAPLEMSYQHSRVLRQLWPAQHCAIWCRLSPSRPRFPFPLIFALIEQALSPGSSPSAPLYFLVLSKGCGYGMG